MSPTNEAVSQHMMEKNIRHRVRVSVYSDYTCPWCYVGAARLQKLKKQLRDEVELVDSWMPFEIHPEVPEGGMSVDELPYSKEQFRQMNAYLRKQAEAEGLNMIERERMSNTHQALAAATFVQNEYPDRFEAFHKGLFETYFVRGEDLSDVEVLRRVAEEAGVPADEVEEVAKGEAYDDAIEATGELARRLGISGTPTFVFEKEFAVVGAHPTDTLRSAVMEVIDKMQSGAKAGEAPA